MSDMLRELMARELVSARLGEAVLWTDDLAANATPPQQTHLWLLQLLLPDLVAALERVIVEPGQNRHRVRRLAGGLLTYVYNPLDLVGDDMPFGHLDDTMICALGLLRLRERDHIELSAGVLAICTLVEGALPLLASDLQSAIRAFVRDLEQGTMP
ncbi:MAG: hypothetical protein IT379_11260 [Deltaproteobacteria bacterium]|nr:hypothetical protein [Deltaproteobacteria bacterium]